MQRQDIINKLESLLDTRNEAQIEQQVEKSSFQRYKFEIDKLTARNKYARVVAKTIHTRDGQDSLGSTSSRFFVDLSNGDILKAASFAAPTKGARGNIFKATDEQRFHTVCDQLYFYAG